VTASKFNSFVPSSRFPIRLVLLALLAACRGGLSPEPPGEDPADARAATPAYKAPTNPYETSAFAEEKAQPGGTMDHGAMNHGAMDHGTMNHGAMDHAGHNAAPSKAPAPAAAPVAPHANHKPEPPR
jgi:uncharacterized protein involved in copper resistance